MSTITISEYLSTQCKEKVYLKTYFGFIPVWFVTKDYCIVTGKEETRRTWGGHALTLLYFSNEQ